jgi:hypothetical protein
VPAGRLALRVSFRATWRQGLLLVLGVGVPLWACAGALAGAGVPSAFSPPMLWAGAMLPVSLFVHEFGHALAAAALVEDRARIVGIGTWTTSSIRRPGAGPSGDALIAVAGPLGGLLCVAPVAFAAGSTPAGAIWLAPFIAHLCSLAPGASDGSQLIHHLRSERGC